MKILGILRLLKRLALACGRSPKAFAWYVSNASVYLRGLDYGSSWRAESYQDLEHRGLQKKHHEEKHNQLLEYFRNNKQGPGIWKWEHYFEVYQRHFSKFVNHPVDILEIGIYSGGSLNMWRSYFGERSHVFGIDIEPACKTYEGTGITIMIGDQENRGFWKTFRSMVPGIDVLIDDGGHAPRQQMVTLEEMLPHLRPGGIYLCEDLHGLHHQLVSFASGLIGELNRMGAEGTTNGFQRCIHSIHFYPYLLVIEKQTIPPAKFHAPKYGTEWQPFFDREIKTQPLIPAPIKARAFQGG